MPLQLELREAEVRRSVECKLINSAQLVGCFKANSMIPVIPNNGWELFRTSWPHKAHIND
jgi:hypothetical protein